MKIYKGAITQLASMGRLTLQVPDACIGEPVSETEEAPDEWFVRLKDNRLACGKEKGFLFLSRAGFNANAGKIEAALEGNERDTTWAEFLAAAIDHFDDVKRNTERYRAKLQKRLDDLNEGLRSI